MLFIVQAVLVIAVILLSIVLMRGGSNARHMAVRRIILLLFSLTAAFSILFPDVLSTIASWFGIGRGADLVLYGFIVSFLLFVASTYQRFRHTETALTRLSRRIALDEAEQPWVKSTENH
jgi:hypothetical protein